MGSERNESSGLSQRSCTRQRSGQVEREESRSACVAERGLGDAEVVRVRVCVCVCVRVVLLVNLQGIGGLSVEFVRQIDRALVGHRTGGKQGKGGRGTFDKRSMGLPFLYIHQGNKIYFIYALRGVCFPVDIDSQRDVMGRWTRFAYKLCAN